MSTSETVFRSREATNPNEFKAALTEKNRGNEDLIKPLIRITKYWNALNNYPFESNALEQMIFDHWKLSTVLSGATLWRRDRDFMNDLDADNAATNHRRDAISKAQRIIGQARETELANDPEGAERTLQTLLPSPQ